MDTNPDPTVVEVELEATVSTVEYLPGIPSLVWTYNGSVPGPRIVANVVDCEIDEIQIGQPVQGFVEEVEEGFKMPVFRIAR